jgi:hypothetical protein
MMPNSNNEKSAESKSPNVRLSANAYHEEEKGASSTPHGTANALGEHSRLKKKKAKGHKKKVSKNTLQVSAN